MAKFGRDNLKLAQRQGVRGEINVVGRIGRDPQPVARTSGRHEMQPAPTSATQRGPELFQLKRPRQRQRLDNALAPHPPIQRKNPRLPHSTQPYLTDPSLPVTPRRTVMHPPQCAPPRHTCCPRCRCAPPSDPCCPFCRRAPPRHPCCPFSTIMNGSVKLPVPVGVEGLGCVECLGLLFDTLRSTRPRYSRLSGLLRYLSSPASGSPAGRKGCMTVSSRTPPFTPWVATADTQFSPVRACSQNRARYRCTAPAPAPAPAPDAPDVGRAARNSATTDDQRLTTKREGSEGAFLLGSADHLAGDHRPAGHHPGVPRPNPRPDQ